MCPLRSSSIPSDFDGLIVGFLNPHLFLHLFVQRFYTPCQINPFLNSVINIIGWRFPYCFYGSRINCRLIMLNHNQDHWPYVPLRGCSKPRGPKMQQKLSFGLYVSANLFLKKLCSVIINGCKFQIAHYIALTVFYVGRGGGLTWATSEFVQFLKGVQLEPFCPFCTRFYMFPTEFYGLWVKIENMIFCTRMYRISDILRGGRVHSNRWIYERKISNNVYRWNLIKPYIGIL